MSYYRDRNWPFTFNNKKDQNQIDVQHQILKNLDWKQAKIKYMCFAIEIGEESKLKHIQGYVEFDNAVCKKTVRKRLCCPGLWLPDKGRQGSRYQARGYIMDPDYPGKTGDFIEGSKVEHGLWVLQGQSKNLVELYEMVKDGSTDYELQESNPVCYARHHKALNKMRFNLLGEKLPNWKNIPIHVVHGETRSKKTSWIFEKEGAKNCFKLKCEGSQLWFDGYNGQKVLIIDDFYGQIRFNLMLQLLDGYKQVVQVKGSHTWAQWDKIYITSNVRPEEWYNNYENIPNNARDALFERITSVTLKIRKNKPRGLPKTVVIDEDGNLAQKSGGNKETPDSPRKRAVRKPLRKNRKRMTIKELKKLQKLNRGEFSESDEGSEISSLRERTLKIPSGSEVCKCPEVPRPRKRGHETPSGSQLELVRPNNLS